MDSKSKRCGIINIGNNCFINVIRQLLCSCPSFIRATLTNAHSKCCRKIAMRSHDSSEFQFWKSVCTYCQLEATGIALLTPRDILFDFVESNIDQIIQTSKTGEMEDAYCFWNSYLHFSEEKNNLKNDNAQNRLLFTNMFRNFEGAWIYCEECGENEQRKDDAFGFYLSAPPDLRGNIHLLDLLQYYMKPETFTHSCKKKGRATRTMRFLSRTILFFSFFISY